MEIDPYYDNSKLYEYKAKNQRKEYLNQNQEKRTYS
jgi:hypothetical protein